MGKARGVAPWALLSCWLLWQAGAIAGGVPHDHPLRGKPAVVNVSDQELPKPELLGTPHTRTLLGYTRRPLHLADGHRMALFSYSASGTANWLFLVDVCDLSFRRHAIPNHDIASHGAALGADGDIYIMPYCLAGSRLHRWDLAENQLTAVAHAGECGYLTEPFPGLWLLADRRSVYRVLLAKRP